MKGTSIVTRTKLGKRETKGSYGIWPLCGVGKLYLSARTTSYCRNLDKIKWSKDKITVSRMPEITEVSEGLSWQMR